MLDIEYLNLPSIPDDLIESVDSIISKTSYTFYSKNYILHSTSNELNDYLKTIFNFKFVSHYQIIKSEIPIHIDINDRTTACNYLLAAGGNNVVTTIYDSNHCIIQSEQIQIRKWHQLNTGKLHGVHGITGLRVGLTITPK
jgi:hypothetical protein